MTTFEFVFGLISIITSLAVTHLIGGLISYVRHRARFSLRHALWSWTAFALVVANWASFGGGTALSIGSRARCCFGWR